MSFKREGDDKCQLNILKRRRTADLLSHFIPEDEAALMKNGRYTCLVCSYRPVFDTVDMLTVHRNGKRHLEGLKAFYGKKGQLKNEMAKRQHENYIKHKDKTQEPSCSAPLLAQTRKLTHHALLKTAPYDSCHRKTRCVRFNIDFHTTLRPRESLHSLADMKAMITQEAEPQSAERRRELKHYLKLKSQGWLQDRSGRWVKDENVEFDSDEEEPPSLAPIPTNCSED
uniref:Sodium channel modifier 1 n=1 Tax=Mola mola TaxID=94237 RepID=A0A3Q4AHL7_MOLML